MNPMTCLKLNSSFPLNLLLSLSPVLLNDMIIYPESIQEEHDLGHLPLSLIYRVPLILSLPLSYPSLLHSHFLLL